MKIGELLLQRGHLDWGSIAFGIADKGQMRLCSFLISRGVLEFDVASRALGEQRSCAAALQRHLEGRDESLADLLPDEVAKKLVALPIGRLGNGALIVCVRDPSPALQARLARILHEDPVLAIAPAHYLERLVEKAYAPREVDADELVDAEEPEVDVPIDVEDPGASDFDIDVDEPAPADRRPRRPSKKRAISVVIPVMKAPAPKPVAERDALDSAIAAFRDADDIEWLFDLAMEYVTKAWKASLLLTLREKRAVGTRGHGARISPKVVKTFVVDIDEVALLEKVRTEKRVLVGERPENPGTDYELLAATLGVSDVPVVAPIMRGDRVDHVLVLAEPIGKELDDALVDLGLLLESMSDALARM
jgi:hypothetical protein